MRELPHLRRLRQPGVGSRQSGRRRRSTTRSRSALEAFAASGTFVDFHPMKGPMTTQSLRGMANHGPMHWRGDRTGGNDPGGDRRSTRTPPSRSSTSPSPACSAAPRQLTDAEMQAFTDFILAGHLSAQPDPQPRQLAHRSDSGRRHVHDRQPARRRHPDRRRHGLQLRRLPHARPRQRASSAPTVRRASRARRRSSRSRTCATCTRRSACSACRRSTSSTPATTATRATRSAASASCTTAASTPSSASCRPTCSTATSSIPSASRTTRSGATSSSSCWPSTRTWHRSSASRSR